MFKKILFYLIIGSLMVLSFSCQRQAVEPISAEMLQRLSWLPSDANFLGYVNFQQMQQSPFFHLFVDSLKDHPFHHPEYQALIDSLGFDFKKDIHELYLAGQFGRCAEAPAGLIMAFGQFDARKILDYIALKDKKQEITKEVCQQTEVYFLDKNEMAFSFVAEKIFVGGKPAAVKAWIERYHQPAESTQVAAEIIKRVEVLPFKTSGWFTLDPQTMLKNVTGATDFQALNGFQDLKYLNFAFKFDEKFHFAGDLECSDAEKAELFRDAIKGALATAKLSVSDDRDAVDVLNKIKLTTRREKIQVHFEMTQAEVQRLIKKHPQFAKPTV